MGLILSHPFLCVTRIRERFGEMAQEGLHGFFKRKRLDTEVKAAVLLNQWRQIVQPRVILDA